MILVLVNHIDLNVLAFALLCFWRVILLCMRIADSILAQEILDNLVIYLPLKYLFNFALAIFRCHKTWLTFGRLHLLLRHLIQLLSSHILTLKFYLRDHIPELFLL